MQNVDPVVRVARLEEHLLVLFKPGVDALPLDRLVARKLGGVLDGLGVRPDRVLGQLSVNLDGPVEGCAFPEL